MRYRYNRHPRKSWSWCKARYWGSIPFRKEKWVFMNPQTGQYLHPLSWLPIQRHKLVKGRHSPDDPTLKDYWRKRQGERGYPQVGLRSKLWKRQSGLCLACQETLDNGEALQVHPIKSRSEGGGNSLSSLLHGSCHRQVHSRYGNLLKPLTGCMSCVLVKYNALNLGRRGPAGVFCGIHPTAPTYLTLKDFPNF